VVSRLTNCNNKKQQWQQQQLSASKLEAWINIYAAKFSTKTEGHNCTVTTMQQHSVLLASFDVPDYEYGQSKPE